MNLNECIHLFLDRYKATTRESYDYCLRFLVDHIGGLRDVQDITKTDIIRFSNALYARDDWAPATKQKHVKAIKAFFNWLVDMEFIDRNPANKTLMRKKLDRAIDRHKAMTDEELEKILDYAKWKPRDYALILFLADTGCRAGGAAGLRVDDVDFSKREATVTEKGDKSRQVAFGFQCSMALRKWLLMRPDHAGEYVFSRTIEPIKADNVSLIVRRCCKAVGIRSLGAHSLRHRKGHQLADARIAPSIAATALGHSDPVVTVAHYFPADWSSAKSALDELVVDNQMNNIILMEKRG